MSALSHRERGGASRGEGIAGKNPHPPRSARHPLPKGEGIYNVLEWLCLALACFFIFAFIYVAFFSMSYPFHFEWMEGQSIDVIRRIRDGLPLYVAPSMEYVPFIYTPYYYYVAAFVSLFTGVDFLAGRLVSTLAALGVGGILYAWIRRESGSWQMGIITAGLFFATYRLSARWFDNARTDSLALLLTLAGLYVLFHLRGRKNALLAAAIFTAAFFTKQSTWLVIAPVLAAWLIVDWRQALIAGGAAAIATAALILIANAASNGWFNFYVFEVPSGHDMDRRYIFRYWRGELWRPLDILCVLSLISLGWLFLKNKRRWFGYAALAVGLVVGSYVMRLHSYSYLNVLMPAHAALALFTGLLLVSCAHLRGRPWTLIAPALIAFQAGTLLYNPNKLIPTAESAEVGNRFLREIAKIEGDIFMPELQWVQTRVGKKSYSYGMAAFDIFRSDLGEKNGIKRALAGEVAQAIREQRFAAIVPGRIFRLPEKRNLYVFERKIPYPREYVTGAINFIRVHLYVPRKAIPNE